MDYEFFSEFGEINVKCSMGFEAVANWFNTEVRTNPTLIVQILQKLEEILQNKQCNAVTFTGKMYSVSINSEEVTVKAHLLHEELNNNEVQDSFYRYDSESVACCGSDDFKIFLQSYLAFSK